MGRVRTGAYSKMLSNTLEVFPAEQSKYSIFDFLKFWIYG